MFNTTLSQALPFIPANDPCPHISRGPSDVQWTIFVQAIANLGLTDLERDLKPSDIRVYVHRGMLHRDATGLKQGQRGAYRFARPLRPQSSLTRTRVQVEQKTRRKTLHTVTRSLNRQICR